MASRSRAELVDRSDSHPALWRRFRLWIAALGLIGFLIAIFADSGFVSGDNYWEAVREVGGAVVAGAILAGLVVWFEDKREEDRFGREEAREGERIQREELRLDQTARKALLRETIMRLNTVVLSDLAEGRRAWLRYLDEESRPSSLVTAPSAHAAPVRSFQTAIVEVETYISLLDSQLLAEAYSAWDTASDQHDRVQPPTPPPPVKRRPGVLDQFNVSPPSFESPPTRDPNAHKQAAALEQDAWNSFLGALHAYAEDQFTT